MIFSIFCSGYLFDIIMVIFKKFRYFLKFPPILVSFREFLSTFMIFYFFIQQAVLYGMVVSIFNIYFSILDEFCGLLIAFADYYWFVGFH